MDWSNLGFGYRKTDYNVRCYYRNGSWGELEVSSEESSFALAEGDHDSSSPHPTIANATMHSAIKIFFIKLLHPNSLTYPMEI